MRIRRKTRKPPPRSARPRVSVLLAHPPGIVRDGLHCLLECKHNFRVVALANDGHEAVHGARRAAPDVALMDVALPRLNGIEATRTILRDAPQLPVLILGAHAIPALQKQAFSAGARGVLFRESDADDLAEALRQVAAGGRYLPRQSRSRREPEPSALTPTEREIVRLVAAGRSNAEVASLIGLSTRTVETYRQRLMRKLGLEDLASLVKFALRQGIADLT